MIWKLGKIWEAFRKDGKHHYKCRFCWEDYRELFDYSWGKPRNSWMFTWENDRKIRNNPLYMEVYE